MSGRQLIALLKKNPVSAGCALASLVLAALIYFFSDTLPAAEAELAEKTALGQRYATNLNYAVQLKEHLEAVVADNKEVEGRLVRISQLAQNLQYFYKLEADTGVKLADLHQLTQSATAPKSTGKNGLLPVAFAVSVQGDYPAVIDFLRRLENGTHFSRVLTCTLSAAGSAGGDPNQPRRLTLTLNLELLGLP